MPSIDSNRVREQKDAYPKILERVVSKQERHEKDPKVAVKLSTGEKAFILRGRRRKSYKERISTWVRKSFRSLTRAEESAEKHMRSNR